MANEWDLSTEGVFEGTCAHCACEAVPVLMSVDPYLDEVCGDRSEESASCLPCYLRAGRNLTALSRELRALVRRLNAEWRGARPESSLYLFQYGPPKI